MKRVFVSDCEGPISKNDNAFELAQNFIPNGDALFTNISKYDDVLADVLHKPGYTAGSTLKLVLPFFKAYGLTDHQIEDFSAQNIFLIANSHATLRYVQKIATAFIVSTSYEHYIRALCNAVGFPFKNTYCTKVNLDKITITLKEKDRLREVAQEIAQMPIIEIPQNAKAATDFSQSDQATIQRLHEIFWSEIPQMLVGKFITKVVTVGGEQKAQSIRDAANRLGVSLSDMMYVGDSITDVEAFRLVRDAGGFTVSFNGNGYAVRNAEVAVMSESNIVLALLADLFCRLGREPALKIVMHWCKMVVQESVTNAALFKELYTVYPDGLPRTEIVTTKNLDSLIEESCEFRRKVRGVAIGRLG